MLKIKWILTLLIALPVLLAGCSPAEPAALSDEEILTFAFQPAGFHGRK